MNNFCVPLYTRIYFLWPSSLRHPTGTGGAFNVWLCLSIFRLFFSCTRTFRRNPKVVDRGRPSGHGRRSSGPTRAVCRAWHALKVCFSAAVDKSISFCARSLIIFPHVRTAYYFGVVYSVQPRPQTKQRASFTPQLTLTWQPCRPTAAAAGSNMRVWQVRAVLWWSLIIDFHNNVPG